MTANTSNRGYTYPQSTDDFRPYEDIQELATDVDTDIAAIVAKLKGYGIRLVQQAGQSLSNGSPGALTYGTGSEGFHFYASTPWHSESVNTTRVTPDVAGWYQCDAALAMAVGGSSYVQLVSSIAKNGTRDDPQTVSRPDPGTPGSTAFVSAFIYCNGSTDYIEHYGTQISSGSNSTNASANFRSTLTVTLWRPDTL